MFRHCKNLGQAGRYSEKKLYYFDEEKLNLSAEKYKAGHPLSAPLDNKNFIDFTDLFGSVELIFRIFNFDFSLKC